ncbi:hypothetical protein MOMA_07221 [Moraxella macacae 0408225]|uniref:TerD domain-containing protein n=1 Tax=Moraxella macacae 0408225 TaxID=1230338 RepID=L2F5J7_9GAMM|nr:TerD family protein [Moraxella macacae]ELA08334.1 hypothetical protein MOMA_07221 [Moraxella macacae 0408225]
MPTNKTSKIEKRQDAQQDTQQIMAVLQQIEEKEHPTIKTTVLNTQFESEHAQDFVTNFDNSQQNPSLATTDPIITDSTTEHYTDDQILSESGQLIDHTATLAIDDNEDLSQAGIAVESLEVSLKQWRFGVHWQKTKVLKSGLINQLKKRKQSMDLDLACLLCNRYGEVIERVWFKNVRDQAESVRYQGDELIGNDDKPVLTEEKQENLGLFLFRIPPHIYQVVLVLSSYTGHALNQVQQGECTLSDDEGNVILKLNLPKIKEPIPAIWLATISRSADSWRLIEQVQGLKSYRQADFEQEISEQLVRDSH